MKCTELLRTWNLVSQVKSSFIKIIKSLIFCSNYARWKKTTIDSGSPSKDNKFNNKNVI